MFKVIEFTEMQDMIPELKPFIPYANAIAVEELLNIVEDKKPLGYGWELWQIVGPSDDIPTMFIFKHTD